MYRRTFVSGSAAAALAAPVAAMAHHGWSSYEAATVLTITAPILESRYQNPHGELIMEDKGKRWTATLAPVSRMEARGLSRDDLAVGKTVTVIGYPSRTTANEMRAERIVANGKTVELR
jgi:hypothetical protein